jgi:hypothetical protein
MIDTPMSRPFLMVYSARPGRGGASDAIYRRAGHPYIRVDVRDTGHLEFSDMVFWGGPLRERPVLGALAPARAVEITRAIVRQYFDEKLLGKRSPLLAGEPLFPEVTVRTVPPPRAPRDQSVFHFGVVQPFRPASTADLRVRTTPEWKTL